MSHPLGVIARLPMSVLPTETCCGREVAVVGPMRYPTAQCLAFNGDLLMTANRFALVFGWQCMVTEHHEGRWYRTTDDEHDFSPRPT